MTMTVMLALLWSLFLLLPGGCRAVWLPSGLKSFPKWALDKLQGHVWETPATRLLERLSTPAHLGAGNYCGGGTVLSQDPVVCVFEDFLTNEECDHLIELAKPTMKPAVVDVDHKDSASGGDLSLGRSNTVTWLAHDLDQVTAAVAEKAASLTGLPLQHSEPIQVIHYTPGQEYGRHMDAFPPITREGEVVHKKAGQRVLTLLAYLNDVERGGSTEFPLLPDETGHPLAVLPRRGSLVLFHNCERGTNLAESRSLHAGLPVESGEKWAFNMWFRERPEANKLPEGYRGVVDLERDAVARDKVAMSGTAGDGKRRPKKLAKRKRSKTRPRAKTQSEKEDL